MRGPTDSDEAGAGPLGFLLSGGGWPYLLVPFIGIAIVLDLVGAPATIVFFCSALAVIPPAALMGRATEELSERSGPAVGGLLNVTFGNAPELIIAVIALGHGLHEVVKASLIGSIVGNGLLVLGASMLAGGLGRKRQTIEPTGANAQSVLLLVGVFALALPGVWWLVAGGTLPAPGAERALGGHGSVATMSLVVGGVLIATYIAALVFSLGTHRGGGGAQGPPAPIEPGVRSADDRRAHWSIGRAIVMLAIAAVAVGGMSEVLVGSISEAAASIGLTEFFVGAIVVAAAGNAAEHWVAVSVARKDKMDLAFHIAIGSATQIALFVTPLLVFVSFFVGPGPMPLVFNGLEIAGVVITGLLVAHTIGDGETTWFGGVQLLAVYVILGVTFLLA